MDFISINEAWNEKKIQHLDQIGDIYEFAPDEVAELGLQEPNVMRPAYGLLILDSNTNRTKAILLASDLNEIQVIRLSTTATGRYFINSTNY